MGRAEPDRVEEPATPPSTRGRTPAERAALRMRQEALLDEAVEETFPASDAIAVVRLI